jgi:hypothetical protein
MRRAKNEKERWTRDEVEEGTRDCGREGGLNLDCEYRECDVSDGYR